MRTIHLGSWILVSVTLTLAGLCAQAPTITHSSVGQVNLIDFPWKNVNTYVSPFLFEAVVPVNAAGTWSLRVRLGSGIANATILYQAYLLEKTSPTGIISTNGVRVRYGN